MGKLQITNHKLKTSLSGLVVLFLLAVFASAQETPPAPSAPRPAQIPAAVEKTLPNNLTVAVVERKNVPLVTIQLMIRAGASTEDLAKAGLANMTASLLTKGTKTKTATQIAEEVEFLGGAINSGANWNNSVVTITVMSDKLEQAMSILADILLNPKFDQKELDLLKSQLQDGLAYNLKQPGFLAGYVASRYSFNEHPAGGTPESLNNITRDDIVKFHAENYVTNNSVLIFTGDIAPAKAHALAQKHLSGWKKTPIKNTKNVIGLNNGSKEAKSFKRLLVIDLPNSGQASVNYLKTLTAGRTAPPANYYYASVLNSVLGGGYSSRLNQEIRIKRGLSYGAGSSFVWRDGHSNFGTRTQTKNESASEVAELVLAEIEKLTQEDVSAAELSPRKLVLTGDFGRDLETTAGLADRIADLYNFNLPNNELNFFIRNVEAVSADQVKDFAKAHLKGGDIVIVGDYSVFKDDLAKRFPNQQIEVIKADELDLTKDNLKK